MFKVGDRIKYKNETHGLVLKINRIYGKTYSVNIEEYKKAPWKVGKSCKLLIYKAETLYELYTNNSEMNSSNTPIQTNEGKPCTCESLTLMRKGCVCGSIVKKKWGLR